MSAHETDLDSFLEDIKTLLRGWDKDENYLEPYIDSTVESLKDEINDHFYGQTTVRCAAAMVADAIDNLIESNSLD
jgi:hypothetical protein